MAEKAGSVGLAMVGCGGISQAHLRGIANTPGAELVATVDAVEEKAKAVAAEYGGVAYMSLQEAFADPRVDAVILALPHDLHLPFTESAAQAGKHVLVEKPMALNLGEARRMVEAADRAGVLLMVGQSTRFQPEVWHAKALIVAGRIGRVRQCIFQRAFQVERLSTPWRLSEAQCGGLYLPLFASHDVDMIWWLMDAAPARVQAVLRSFTNLVEAESDGAMMLEFEGEAFASLGFSLNSRVQRHSALFVGTEGALIIDRGELAVNGEAVVVDRAMDSFTRQMHEFVAAIQQGRPPSPSGRDALRTMAVLDAAKIAAQDGCSVAIDPSTIS